MKSHVFLRVHDGTLVIRLQLFHQGRGVPHGVLHFWVVQPLAVLHHNMPRRTPNSGIQHLVVVARVEVVHRLTQGQTGGDAQHRNDGPPLVAEQIPQSHRQQCKHQSALMASMG
mgnify:CR=1 FL=1